jgi:hypothetical protein
MRDPDHHVESPGFADFALRLRGTIEACAIDSGYWHRSVWLRCLDGTVHEFTSEQHSLAPYFEVFSLAYSSGMPRSAKWVPFSQPITVSRSLQMWRDEWNQSEEVVPAGAVGGPPYFVQFCRPVGTIPANATASARVLAGVCLEDASGSKLAVFASTDAPLNVDVACSPQQVKHALAFHTLSP